MAKIVLANLSESSGAIDDLCSALDLARPTARDEVVVTVGRTGDDLVSFAALENAALIVLVVPDGAGALSIVPLVDTLAGQCASSAIVVAADTPTPADVAAVLTHGAREFLGLPLQLGEASGRLRSVMNGLQSGAAHANPVPGFIGENARLHAELRKIPIVAESDATVLIAGETGTGKELCARAIHDLSRRRQKAFVPINCGAMPPELVENELFGHERGAFTGASSGRPGLVREADGGTLFLDEINSLPLTAQVKLLRLLQDGTFRALGSTRLQQANLRIVAATNDDLAAAVADGRFRQDLFYRLNVIPLYLPALRDRRDDIGHLAQFFIDRYAQRTAKRVIGLAPDALTKLVAYSWPGNVRELEHVIERAVVLSTSSRLLAGDLTLGSTGDERPSFQDAKAQVVGEFERGYLRSILRQHQGNISHAAVAAGKDRRAFWELLRKHAIDPSPYRSPSGPRRQWAS